MNITQIQVHINTKSTDHVFVDTDAPSPTPALSKQPLCLRFEVAAGEGVEYVRKNFPQNKLVIVDYANFNRY